MLHTRKKSPNRLIASPVTALGGAVVTLGIAANAVHTQQQFDDAVLDAMRAAQQEMKANPIYSADDTLAIRVFDRQWRDYQKRAEQVGDDIARFQRSMATNPVPPEGLEARVQALNAERARLQAGHLAVYKAEDIQRAADAFRKRHGVAFPIPVTVAPMQGSFMSAQQNEFENLITGGVRLEAKLLVSPATLQKLTRGERRAVQEHEHYHFMKMTGPDGRLIPIRNSTGQETEADIRSIAATCDLPSATSALAKTEMLRNGMGEEEFIAQIEQRRGSLTATLKEALRPRDSHDGLHPEWTQRVRDVREAHGELCKDGKPKERS